MRMTIVVLGWLLLQTVPAFAEPITAGSFNGFGAGGNVWLSSGRFTFDGVAAPWGGVGPFDAFAMPGETVRLDANWSGLDLPGTASWNGTTIPDVGAANGLSGLYAEWLAELTLPSLFSGGALQTPFTFAGRFMWAGGPIDLSGAGTLTAFFAPRDGGGYSVRGFAYDFGGEELTPNPEPGTWLLLLTGAAGVIRFARQRSAS